MSKARKPEPRYGEGLPFTQRDADIYRELCALVATTGRTPGGKRRVDLMIAAIAIGIEFICTGLTR